MGGRQSASCHVGGILQPFKAGSGQTILSKNALSVWVAGGWLAEALRYRLAGEGPQGAVRSRVVGRAGGGWPRGGDSYVGEG